MSHARETTLTLFIMYLCPLKLKSCAAPNSYTVCDNLMIFGVDIYRSSRSVTCKKNSSCFVIFLVISPE